MLATQPNKLQLQAIKLLLESPVAGFLEYDVLIFMTLFGHMIG